MGFRCGQLRRRTPAGLAALAVGAVLAGGAAPAVATTSGGTTNGSLPAGPSPRPGPDLLYQPLATAPQLTNTGIWQAAPILVSGASAYPPG